MKKILSLILLLPLSVGAREVNNLRIIGPSRIATTISLDTADVRGNRFDHEKIAFENTYNPLQWNASAPTSDGILPRSESLQTGLIGYQLENTSFVRVRLKTEGVKKHETYVDGKLENGIAQLVPGRHDIVIKYLQDSINQQINSDTIKCSFERLDHKDNILSDSCITLNPEGNRYWTLADLMHGERLSSHYISASGRYIVQNRYITRTDGKTDWSKTLIDLNTGSRNPISNFVRWTPIEGRYLSSRRDAQGNNVYEYVDVATGKKEHLLTWAASDNLDFQANDRYALIYRSNPLPEELNRDVHQILEPDDRQPGWRNRSNLYLLEVATGVVRPITSGQQNVSGTLNHQGTKLLLQFWTDDVTRRPFNFSTALLMDLSTGAVDTLYVKDGFVSSAQFSPDDSKILFQGSPEAFHGVGNTLPDSVIPSSIENELFIMNLADHSVRSITRELDPSIISAKWNKADGNIYALCENRDRQDIFRYDCKQEKWTQLPLSQPYVNRSYSLSTSTPLLVYTGMSSNSTDKAILVNLRNMKETIIDDLNPSRLSGITLGECTDWNFRSSRGDTIYGCCYLPPHFDASRHYPMLVYYYGGCSPVGRYLESYYCYQEWAAMGYVVYVLQPSGATGFGQEFASRHVNTYGDYTADDIIEGTRQFCLEHPFVDPSRIGCLGASYGGFMTQWLQVKTDIFAAAMSHAGISNPASYWGYGYWGYSYSGVSCAESYPWNNLDLFSGHAPLFHADKIHTPLLFMHGASDTNVPINESIQMFTALKILGRETAFVTVEGQDHHILDYNKRIAWHNTIMAWFQRYLQNDPTWWETLYPTKNY